MLSTSERRKGKIIVIGSNARGTAYAIMELSRMAGVSPMAGWNDLKPQTRQESLYPGGPEKIEIPRIEFRGLALNGSKWMNPKNYSRMARLMLRLRANTLWQVDGKHEAAYNKAVVDSFDICVAENYKVTEIAGKKHKKKHQQNHREREDGLLGNQMQMENISPALVLEMLNNRGLSGNQESEHREKSHRSEAHYDEDCAWIANVTNPKMVNLQLAMMSDLAWNRDALQGGISKTYLQNTGSTQSLRRHYGQENQASDGGILSPYQYPTASLIWRCHTAIQSFIRASSATSWSAISTPTTC